MKTYIALLRGINVSKKKKVPMAELKACLPCGQPVLGLVEGFQVAPLPFALHST